MTGALAFGVIIYVENLIQYFKNVMFDSLGRFCSPRTSLKYHEKNKEALEFLKNKSLNGIGVSEAVHCLIFDVKIQPVCEYCQNLAKFDSFASGYKKTCQNPDCLRKSYGKNPHFPSDEERRSLSERMKKNNPMFKKEIAEKVRKTQRKNNNGILPMHNEESKEKALNSRYDKYNAFAPKNILYKPKEYLTKSGAMILIQGYEGMALDLLYEKYKESDIVVCGRSHSFLYNFNGRKRYYPDIFLPTEDKYIEVKSEYTYLSNLEMNLAKKKAVEDSWFKFEFWIFDNDKNLKVK